MTASPVTVGAALGDPHLLGASLGPVEPWSTWLSVLKATFGHTLNQQERSAFEKVAGGRAPPARQVHELWCVIGRRGGKSRIAAALATFIAAFIDHRKKLAPGEIGHVLVLAPTQAQASVVFGYTRGFFEQSCILRQQVEAVTASELRLKDNIVIGVHPNSFRTVRGRTLLACVFDEVAYWRDETSASPDLEVYRAVLPALATTGGMLVGISSPYRRIGLLHQKHRDHFGKQDDDVLVVQGATADFNPTLDLSIVKRARASDPGAAQAEWDAEFRSDLNALLDDAVIDAAVVHGRPLELSPQRGVKYVAFADASGGRHDRYTICIGHKEGKESDGARFVCDVLRGARTPFDPSEVTKEYAALAKDYGIRSITGDAYSGEWVASAFEACGARYQTSPLPKSALYLEALPIFNRGAISIPDIPILIRELRLLERRVHRFGRDSVDHGHGGSDDYANALCGAAYVAVARSPGDRYADFLNHVIGPEDRADPRWTIGQRLAGLDRL